MNKDECTKIGFIAKLHGYKGEVTIYIDDEFEDALMIEDIKTLLIEINEQLIPYFIEKIGGNSSAIVVLFEDINTEAAAKKLLRKSVYLKTKDIPKGREKKDDISQLIGFMIVDKEHGELGIVDAILEFPSQLLLQLKYKSKEVLIPLTEPLVSSINKKKKIINVDLPEGFLEI